MLACEPPDEGVVIVAVVSLSSLHLPIKCHDFKNSDMDTGSSVLASGKQPPASVMNSFSIRLFDKNVLLRTNKQTE